jgi:hypothetical protein
MGNEFMKSLTAGPNSTLKKGISCPNNGEGFTFPWENKKEI